VHWQELKIFGFEISFGFLVLTFFDHSWSKPSAIYPQMRQAYCTSASFCHLY
jgi:hypothetical protein